MNIRQIASPHFDVRQNGTRPVMLLMHYTTLSAAETVHVFTGRNTNPNGQRVSAHYMIDKQGHIAQFVDEKERAWHAGVSYWGGNTDINSASIGIELVNAGHERGYRPFPAAQMAALVELSSDIMARQKIKPASVLAHSDVAPDRKRDPGELFGWEMLAGKGIGLWPKPNADHYTRATKYLQDKSFIKEALGRYGYNTAHDLDTLVCAFQRHFVPEAFHALDAVGVVDRETLARLLALIDQKS